MKIIPKIKLQLLVLIFLCFICFLLRSYETYRDLVFTYDQGRDAIMMQKIESGHPTLIGPVTGLDGVYLGPFWYYLIFPFYFLGQGNPVFAAIEMKLFSVGVVIFLYMWGRKAKLSYAGLLAGALYTFSFSNIIFARWLSNPVPLPFFAILGFYTLWSALQSKKWWLFAFTGFIFGCCLQLEAANAFWFIPSTAVIFFVETGIQPWKRDRAGTLRRMAALIGGFSLTVLPQFLFELKYHFLITKNLLRAFQTTHETSLLENLPHRIPLLFELYGRGLFEKQSWLFIYISLVFLIALYMFRKVLFASQAWRIAAIWFFVPCVFHILYTGNHGNFWDYYVISQHVALYLLLGLTLALIARIPKWRSLATILAASLLVVSSAVNLSKWQEIIPPYASRFSLQEQVDANTWITQQSKGESYGIWVYTPSAQDDPYRYIFNWQGKKTGIYPGDHVEQQSLIYLVVEDDAVFWKRERDWISERMKFGTLLERKRFGALTVYKLHNTFIGGKTVQ